MDIIQYFDEALKRNASDLHLTAGSKPALRVNGDLVKLSDEPVGDQELKTALEKLVDKDTLDVFALKKEHDLAINHRGSRFRINLHFQEGGTALTARLIPSEVPKPEVLGFNEVIYKLTHLADGLILITGPTGSGKSTTLAAMIDIINRERRAHVITIEDPIEFLFKEQQSIIEQRELGRDTYDYASALKHALREDPNVIMVGEMRDRETIAAALAAAETGHLVFSTLHTTTAPETVRRIVDSFSADQHQLILNQLATNLRAVISQHLLPNISGQLVAAREIMINNRAVANLIRTNQIEQLYSIMQTSMREGMITMNKSIEFLWKQGVISENVAKNRIRDQDTMAVYY